MFIYVCVCVKKKTSRKIIKVSYCGITQRTQLVIDRKGYSVNSTFLNDPEIHLITSLKNSDRSLNNENTNIINVYYLLIGIT